MSCSPADGPLARHANGVSLAVQLRPGARMNAIEGLAHLGDGRRALKVLVTEQPERGRANRALIELLAKRWHLPRGTISILSGARDHRKVLLIEGESDTLLAELARRLEGLEGGRGRSRKKVLDRPRPPVV
jgi:uncharacterized protein YggU (UPF0235/DUF167 family)